MSIRNDEKDKSTQQLRIMIGQKIHHAYETASAELSMCNLSFQSTQMPERSVWIDLQDPKHITIDLEDWNVEDEWDNAIARVSVKNLEEAVQLTEDWLSGKGLADYAGLNMEYKVVKKQV